MSIFQGSAVAIVTPFRDGAIDFTAFTRLIELQIASGTDAIVVCGTTGESATMTVDERLSVIQFVVERVNGRVPVIAGTGGNCTETVIESSRSAEAIGVDGLLIVTPYYNKTTQAGLVAHYNAVADSVDLPIIVYNVPSRTGVDLTLSQYKTLAAISGIRAVKEASPNMTKVTRLCAETPLAVYSGNDDMTLPVVSLGGSGVISVLSNLAPAAVSAMARAAADGDFQTARRLAHKYARLVSLLFAETNPAPLKYAMELLGLCAGELRLPLAEVDGALKEKIRAEMTALSML